MARTGGTVPDAAGRGRGAGVEPARPPTVPVDGLACAARPFGVALGLAPILGVPRILDLAHGPLRAPPPRGSTSTRCPS